MNRHVVAQALLFALISVVAIGYGIRYIGEDADVARGFRVVAHVDDARAKGATVLTGTSGATLGLALGLMANGPLGFAPYVLAGAALDLAVARDLLHRHRWLIIPLAGAVHLLALIVPVQKALSVGVAASALAYGLWPVVVSHLVFGLTAGTIAYTGVRLAEHRRRHGA